MNACSVNLLPENVIRRFEHQRQLRRWIPIWLGVTVLLTLAQYGLTRRCSEADVALEGLTGRVAALRAVEAKTRELQSDSQRMEKALNRQASLEQQDMPLGLLQTVATACSTLGHAIQLDSYRMEETAAPAIDAGAAAATDVRPPPGKRVVVTGTADSDYTVSRFVRLLREGSVFREVALEASQADAAAGESSQRSFQLRCEVKL